MERWGGVLELGCVLMGSLNLYCGTCGHAVSSHFFYHGACFEIIDAGAEFYDCSCQRYESIADQMVELTT